MPYDPSKHHRRSIRLKGYDYSGPGWYYLTICTFERQFLFGEIVRSQMRPSIIGAIAQECWNQIPKHFSRAALDVSIVMPNHLHGILIINGGPPIDAGSTGTLWRARRTPKACHAMPLQTPRHPAAFGQPVPGSLATILGLFKQAVTRRVESQRAYGSYGHDTACPCPQGMPWHARTSRDRPHIWHENYYEHIIRNEKELNRIREYICTNPLRWPYDVENPACEGEAADDIEELLAADDDEL